MILFLFVVSVSYFAGYYGRILESDKHKDWVSLITLSIFFILVLSLVLGLVKWVPTVKWF